MAILYLLRERRRERDEVEIEDWRAVIWAAGEGYTTDSLEEEWIVSYLSTSSWTRTIICLVLHDRWRCLLQARPAFLVGPHIHR